MLYNWWETPSGEDDEYEAQMRANSLIENMRALEETHKEVHSQNLFNYQLYNNRFLSCFDWGTGILTSASLSPVSHTTDNVVLEVCDAILAEVGKARPKAKPICHGASWKDRQNARKLDKFLYGEFVKNDIYEAGKSILLNAEVCGFGVARVDVEEDDDSVSTCVQSIFPDDILIDQQEVVATRKINHVYHRRVLPVEVVAATWDIPEEEVVRVAEDLNGYISYRPVGKGYVVVGEAYRVGTEKNPGRHVIAIKDNILVDEAWEHDWTPFVFFHWARPLTGFYSSSAVEQILPDQVRLNEINDVIAEAQDIMCGPRLLVAQGSKVNPAALDNVIGKVLYYTGGQPPEAVTWPAVAAELYNERDRLRANAFMKLGVNQSAASGNLPAQARLDSAPAVRELGSVQDSRLADVTQRYEKLFLDIAKTMVRVARASGKNATTVWYSGGKKSRAEKIAWKDIDLDDKAYTMVLEAASSFSMTPSAIRDDLEAQLMRGEITPEQYRKQLASPDPDNETSILAAAAENIDFTLEMLEEGKYLPPTPEQDLVNGVKRVTLGYLNLDRYEDVPVEIREAMLNWIEEAQMWLNRAAEPAPEMEAAPPAQMPMTPGGMAPPMPMGM